MARPPLNPWRETVRLSEVTRAGLERRLSPGPDQLADIARTIGVDRLDRLDARVTLTPWLDGAELRGRFNAQVVQTCGVTLEPLDQAVDGEFMLRLVPLGSVNLPANDVEEIDPDADDPPEELAGEEIDLAHYVVEHLALEIDPFPRKPGAVFEPPEPEEEASPFAVLRRLKQDDAPE